MASITTAGTNSQPARPAPVPVIRQHDLSASTGQKSRQIILILAFALSLTVHGAIIVLFWFGQAVFGINFLRGGEAVPKEVTVIESQVDDTNPKPADLENDEMGLDPEVPTNYDVNNIQPVSVPGPVNKDESVGIPGAPDGPPVTLPPPPGIGGNIGHGAGVDSPLLGTASRLGLPGGFLGAPRLIPGGFGGRSGATRQQLVREGGGNPASEAAVARGILWLIRHQAPDGHWSLDGFHQHGRCNCTGRGTSNDIAATAFGLLPLLGGGQTHRGGGKYTKNVERGLKFLLTKQNAEGDFGGGMYAHALAAITVCEAYGLTADPVLKRPAQYALNFIVQAQNDNGGWRYTPRSGSSDTSVTGWQVMALKSGQLSGLEVPSKTMAGADRWLDKASSANGSSYGYDGPGASPTMTAVGLLCREYRGWGPRLPALRKGVEVLKKTPPGSVNNMYYYYYATQVMHHFGGPEWNFWNPRMLDYLINKQDKGNTPKHAHQYGSWAPKGDAWGGQGGRIMTTSLAVLTLEVYYRHLPLYRRGGDMANVKK